MVHRALLASVVALASSIGLSQAGLAQPVGFGKTPVVEEETPTDLPGFAKARTRAKGRVELQEKRLQAAGTHEAKRLRAAIDLAQQHWDLAQLCDFEALSGLLEEALDKAGKDGDEAAVLELKARQAEVEQCVSANRQAAQELLAENLGEGESGTFQDEALFYLGWYELQAGRKKEGMGHVTRLLREFPQSPFAPEGWLLVGEYNFELSAMEKAVEAYQKVTADTKNRLYPFALYKLAWSHFNMAEYDLALKELMQTVSAAGESPHWQSLAREASDSLPTFFAEVEKPAVALEFFRKMDPERAERLLAKLALLYSDQGKFNDSTYLCRTLLSEYPKSQKALGYRLLVVKNQGARGDASALVSEFEALADASEGADPALVKQASEEAAMWIASFEKERSPAREPLIQRLKVVQEKLGR